MLCAVRGGRGPGGTWPPIQALGSLRLGTPAGSRRPLASVSSSAGQSTHDLPSVLHSLPVASKGIRNMEVSCKLEAWCRCRSDHDLEGQPGGQRGSHVSELSSAPP